MMAPTGSAPATQSTANNAAWAHRNAPAPANAVRVARVCCAPRTAASRACTVASMRPSAPNARTSRQPVIVSSAATRNCPIEAASRVPALGGGARGAPWQHERRQHEQDADDSGQQRRCAAR